LGKYLIIFGITTKQLKIYQSSILYFLQKEVKAKETFISENLNDLCASVQQTIIDILFKRANY
jgi:tRNA A37 threonylcarbamoyltransferase TsaD